MAGWIKDLWGEYQQRKNAEILLHKVTEKVVDVADPLIRQARGYRKVLHAPVSGAIDYCRRLVDDVPGPVFLSKSKYHADPLVKAMFASPEELDEVINISPEVVALREKGFCGEVSALLTAETQEKTIFGYQQEGEMVLRDVPQRAVNFIDHRIVAPTGDLFETKTRIVDRGVEVLATVAMEQITTLKSRKATLREKREYLKGMMRILGGKNHMLEMFALPNPGKLEEFRKAEKLLVEVEQEIDGLNRQMTYPEHSLGYLETILQKPDESLVLHKQSYRLNWMGVRVDDLPENEGNEITLAEFLVGREFKRSAVLVNFSIDKDFS